MNKPSICYGIIPDFCDQVGDAFMVDPVKWWIEQVDICSRNSAIDIEAILKAYPMPFEVVRYGDSENETFILAVPGSVMTFSDNSGAELFHESDLRLDSGGLLDSNKLKIFHNFIELYSLEGNCGWWFSSFFQRSDQEQRITFDEIDHPKHYQACGGELEADGTPKYETIKVIESFGANNGFCMGNVIKYLLRAEYKGSCLDDLRKAGWYLNRYLSKKKDYPRYNSSDVAKSWNLSESRSEILRAIFVGNSYQALDLLKEEIRVLEEE